MKPVVPVYDHQEYIKQFVEQGLWDDGSQFGPCYCLGFANEDEGLVAGMVYHNYCPRDNTIELSAYASRQGWSNKKWIHLIFDYPFSTWNVRLLTARHSERNKRARRIWDRVGAKEYVIDELRGPDEAEAIAVLTQGNWKSSRFNLGDIGYG